MDRKEYQKEWIRKKRAKGKELTLEVAKEIEASTPTVDNVDYNFKVPERAKVLPAEVIKGILAVLHSRATASLCQDDSSARWDRAITYHNWRLAYKPAYLPGKYGSDNSPCAN